MITTILLFPFWLFLNASVNTQVAKNVWMHPDFNANGAGVDNWFKSVFLLTKIQDSKNKAVKTDKQVDIMSIDFLNKLRNATYNKSTDGSKFGDKRKTVIIDSAPKVEADNFVVDE